jgi:hypothetical protein
MHFGEPHRGMSRTLLLSVIGLGIVVVLVFALTIKLLGKVPPRTVVMSTGPEGGDLVRRRLMQRPGNSRQRAGALATTSTDCG